MAAAIEVNRSPFNRLKPDNFSVIAQYCDSSSWKALTVCSKGTLSMTVPAMVQTIKKCQKICDKAGVFYEPFYETAAFSNSHSRAYNPIYVHRYMASILKKKQIIEEDLISAFRKVFTGGEGINRGGIDEIMRDTSFILDSKFQNEFSLEVTDANPREVIANSIRKWLIDHKYDADIKNVRKVWLDRIGLRLIPWELISIFDIDWLILSQNHIQEIPEAIGKLPHISFIDLSWNLPHTLDNRGREVYTGKPFPRQIGALRQGVVCCTLANKVVRCVVTIIQWSVLGACTVHVLGFISLEVFLCLILFFYAAILISILVSSCLESYSGIFIRL